MPRDILRRWGRAIGAVTLLGGFCAILTQAQPAAATPIVPFTVAFHTQDNGSVGIFGNTLLTCPPTAAGCPQAQQGQGSNLNNNSWNMTFLDVDNDPATFDSSSSTVDLPPGSTVLWAGLYWGARRTAGSGGSAASGNLQQMLFKTPAGPSYQTINVGSFYDGTGFDAGRGYQSFAVVTGLVQAAGAGDYFGANVVAATGADRYAGWSLIVVYRNPALPLRDLTVFNGFSYVQTGPADTIALTGFLAPPFGPVKAQLGVVAYEGDLGTTGDSMTLNGTKLSDAANPANNFFNVDDTSVGFPVTTRNPNFPNLMGFDLKTIAVNSIIPNSATSATIGLSTTGDVYFPGAVTSQIDLYAPTFPAMTKSVTDLDGNDPAQVGDHLRFTLSYPNVGQDPATGVVTNDQLPPNVTYVPGSLVVASGANAGSKTDGPGDDQAEYNAGTRTVTFRLGAGANATQGGTLNPGESTSVTFDATIDPAAAGNSIDNTATIDYTAKTISKSFTYTGNTTSTPVAAIADVSITKTAPASAIPGSPLTYTLTASNAGPAPADAVTVSDPLPPELTGVSATSSSGTCSVTAGALACGLATLAPGASVTITVNSTVSASATSPIVNTASVDSTTPDPNDTNNVATVSTELIPSADLSIAKTLVPPTPVAGGAATFKLSVSNAGPSDAQDVSVTDPLQAGLVVGSVSTSAGSCSTSATQVVCALGSVPAGGGASIQIPVTLPSGFNAANLSNGASAESSTADPDLSNNQASVAVPTASEANLSLTKTATATATAGGPVTYTMTVANAGPSDATNTVLTDPMPGQVTPTVVTSSAGSCTTSTPIICDLGTVVAGTPVTVTVTGTIDPGATAGTITNVASVASSTDDPDPSNNTAMAATSVTATADLSVTKSANPSSLVAGKGVTYTMTVANAGPDGAEGATLADPLPSGLIRSSVTTSAGTCARDGDLLDCSFGTIPASGSVRVTLTGTVDPSDGDASLVNAVTVQSAVTDPSSGNNTATVSTPLDHVAGLVVTKTVNDASPDVHGTVTYTVKLSATGPSVAFVPVLSDPLPSGLTFVSATTTSGAYDPDNGTWVLGDLSPGDQATLHVVAGVDGPGTEVNTASLIPGQEPDPTSGAATASASITARTSPPPASSHLGYWLAGRDGGVFAFGAAPFLGSLPHSNIAPAAPISGIASSSHGPGYWLVGQDGGVFAFGSSGFRGSLPSSQVRPAAPISGIAPTKDDAGYWLVGQDGGVFAFGDAKFYGSLPGTGRSVLPQSIISLVPTPSGTGYWLVDSLGATFPFGDASAFGGSTSGVLPRPITGAAAQLSGSGLWLAGPDGGLVTLGSAPNAGSMAGQPLHAPISSMTDRDASGYWMAGQDGGVFAFGDAPFLGSLPAFSIIPFQPISGIAAD